MAQLLIFCKDKTKQIINLSPKFWYQDDQLRRKCSPAEVQDKAKTTAISIVSYNNYFTHELIK